MIPDYVKDKEAFLDTYLGRMPEEERAEEALLQQRLEVCDGCAYALNGMCRLCGCFLVIRAAGRKSYCPASPRKW